VGDRAMMSEVQTLSPFRSDFKTQFESPPLSHPSSDHEKSEQEDVDKIIS
jgi:hypothetical protein